VVNLSGVLGRDEGWPVSLQKQENPDAKTEETRRSDIVRWGQWIEWKQPQYQERSKAAEYRIPDVIRK
jgi:hypothetical protein